MSNQTQAAWIVRRRRRHQRPRRKLGTGLAGPVLAEVAAEFPSVPRYSSRSTHVVSGAVSLLLHLGVLGTLLLFAWLAPPDLVEVMQCVAWVEPGSWICLGAFTY